MRLPSRRALVRIAVVSLLLAGVATPALYLGQPGASAQTQSQLVAMVSAAQTSRTYAYSTVNAAASHGLALGSAQSQLSAGDSLLVTAQADAQSGNNVAAGIQAAQAAMSDYTSAAVTAGVALTGANLTASVDYTAEIGAVAEVNSTASLVASVSSNTCANGGATVSNATAFSQLCADEKTRIAAATSNLKLASSYLIQANGNATVNLSEVRTLVGMARAQVTVGWQDLAALASYTYTSRGGSYVSSALLPLSAQANATVKAELSLRANLTAFQNEFSAYAISQSSAVANITSTGSALVSAIGYVNTDTVSSNISASETAAALVKSNMSSLLEILGISSFPSVIADIQASNTATSSYIAALVSARSQIADFSESPLSYFGSYLGIMDQDRATVLANGTAYVSAYQKVVEDIDTSAILAIPGVQAIYNGLTSLQVAVNVSSTNHALQTETDAMGNVEVGINSVASAVASARSAISVVDSLNATANFILIRASAFLNSTGMYYMGELASGVQDVAGQAHEFTIAANSTLSTSIVAFDAFYSSEGTLVMPLNGVTQGSIRAASDVVAYVNSDTSARISTAASGQAEISDAMSLFSKLNISAGVAAFAQATVYFQAASSASV
jgi:hypothetical protein